MHNVKENDTQHPFFFRFFSRVHCFFSLFFHPTLCTCLMCIMCCCLTIQIHTHTELERREQSHPFLLKKGIVSSLVFYPLRPMRSFHYYSTPSDFFCLCQYIQHIHCVPASTSRAIDVSSPVNQIKQNKTKQNKKKGEKTRLCIHVKTMESPISSFPIFCRFLF
jgi:hypothetical protein